MTKEPGFALKAAVGGTLIAVLLVLFLLLASLVASLASKFVGVPEGFATPPELQGAGLLCLAAGVGFLFWTVRVRRPTDIVLSSWATFRKLLGGTSIKDPSGRTEEFVPRGPYRHVRNPMYFGVVDAVLGGGLYSGSTTLVVWALLLLAWFLGYLIPFEERELLAIFGSRYASYRSQVPEFVPYGRRYTEPA